MQNDPRFFTGQGSHGYAYGAEDYPQTASMGGYYAYGGPAPFGTTTAAAEHGGILNGVEFQPADNCPDNFLIFDKTEDRSRIMYNPAFGQKLSYPGYHAPTVQVQGGSRIHDYDARGKSSSSSHNEDSDDIDALLSIEDDEDEDDDVVSTGRTPSYRCNSPDSICSTGGSKSVKQKYSGPRDSAASAGTSNERKRERMKKMVKTLRGIVPGGQQMDTPAFLDEAVRYLKSLKVEVRKLGIKN